MNESVWLLKLILNSLQNKLYCKIYNILADIKFTLRGSKRLDNRPYLHVVSL